MILSMSKHATVKVDGYTIPLIGIPPSATEDWCDVCGKKLHLSEVNITEDGRMVCQEHYGHTKETNPS